VRHEGGLLLEAEDCPRNLVRLHDGVSRRHPHEQAAKVLVKEIDLGKANCKRWDSPCQVRHLRRDLPRRPHNAAGQGDVRLKSRRCIFPAQIEDCCCQAVTNFPGGHQPKRITRCFLVWAHTDLSGSLMSWASIGVVCVQKRNSRRWTLPTPFYTPKESQSNSRYDGCCPNFSRRAGLQASTCRPKGRRYTQDGTPHYDALADTTAVAFSGSHLPTTARSACKPSRVGITWCAGRKSFR